MDLLLDPETHDLVIEDYDLQLVGGVDLVRQRLKQRLLFFLGEWFLAVNEGVPYFQDIFIKSPDRGRVESIFKATIMKTPGVAELLAFQIDYDAALRRFRLDFQVRPSLGEDGEVIDLTIEV